MGRRLLLASLGFRLAVWRQLGAFGKCLLQFFSLISGEIDRKLRVRKFGRTTNVAIPDHNEPSRVPFRIVKRDNGNLSVISYRAYPN